MFEFVIDTEGSHNDSWSKSLLGDEPGPACDSASKNQNFIPLDELPASYSSKGKKKKKTSSEDCFSLNNTYLITNYMKEKSETNEKSLVDKLMEKSVVNAGLEKLTTVPVRRSKRALAKERKIVRDRTKGKDWYNIPATEVTCEIKNDLNILRMRSALDSKHFYKKNTMKILPKYFQVGKIVEGAADFYSGRIPKSERKKTIVEELLADSNFKAYQKKKYKEIVDDSRRRKKKNSDSSKKKLKKNNKDDWLSWD